MSKIEEVAGLIVEDAVAKRRKLTPRRERFVKAIIENPLSPRQAAILAGYSPKSASVTASRLLRDTAVQHELAQHFLSQESLVSEALTETLQRLHHMVREGGNKDFLRAAKLLMEYTRMAVPVLGLDIKQKEKQQTSHEPVDAESLIEQHEREIAKLRELLPIRPPTN